MTNVERFRALMAFKPVDRLPVIEWASWWDQTLARWRAEGLDAHDDDAGAIRDAMGQDCYRQLWISAFRDAAMRPEHHGPGLIGNMDDYLKLKPHLYPDQPLDLDRLGAWIEPNRDGHMVVWFTLEGFFWFARSLLGIEPHMYAFADQPQLLHQINEDLLAFNERAVEAISALCSPQFVTIAEDMAYNHGPMISQACFETFLAPYYRRLVPVLEEKQIVTFVDSDGDMTQMIAWLQSAGIRGVLPLERMAGVDVVQLRKRHPQLRMIGAFDKTVMKLGEDAIRGEFDRLMPVMSSGGFIPSVDHQTPPDVSLAMYRRYVTILREYCQRAVLG